MAPQLLSAIEAALSAATGTPFRAGSVSGASGGCIHRSFVLEGGGERYFAKTNERRYVDAFQAEADGLGALARSGARAPRCLCHGEAGTAAFLVLEFLELRSAGDGARLGHSLAALHAHHGSAYGWHRDNYIGATPQHNRQHGTWAEFWRDERLRPQLELAARNGHRQLLAIGERLCETIGSLLRGHEPPASLLHGDLWGGNAAFLADGTPVLFDPAVYYGDAETDLAMTELFGGFAPGFYAAYRELRPLDAGYAVRKDLYNLYHVLNHANLFGGGYVSQAKAMIGRLIALA
jgi:fructosamine-3-kinase